MSIVKSKPEDRRQQTWTRTPHNDNPLLLALKKRLSSYGAHFLSYTALLQHSYRVCSGLSNQSQKKPNKHL